MKRVYVETNFLVDLLRPLRTKEATALHSRHGNDIELTIPWCCFKEVERTLMDRVVDEDIGFASTANAVWARLREEAPGEWESRNPSVHQFLDAVRDLQRRARADCVIEIEKLMDAVVVVPMSQRATDRALEFSRVKRLKPFD